jgi:multiple sugar transport system ATP-binding protein
MTLADRIVIMKDGHIQQVGTPSDVFQNPANMFVAQFIGAPSMNMLEGTATETGVLLTAGPMVAHQTNFTTDKITVGIRPGALVPALAGDKVLMEGTIEIVEPLGAESLAYVDIHGTKVIATVSGRTPPNVGEALQLTCPPEEIHFFDSASGVALS